MLINLVDNAIRYTPRQGVVTVRCGAQAGLAWLEVEDSGPGIPSAEHDRVLERFYRLPGTLIEGNGLGLAIADEIARAHATQLVLSQGADGQGLLVRVVFGKAG
jgi:two-component system sensor histidine kinase TctE